VILQPSLEDVKIVSTGVGAAGIATLDVLHAAGARNIVGCDQGGAIHRDRSGLPAHKAAFAERSNPDGDCGSSDESLAGADVFIGLSVPGAVSAEAIRTMAPDAIVFAMANPTPEVVPEDIADDVAVVATGRSDYPNQINNVLAFPGVFRGALDVRATAITREMEVAAAEAIAATIADDELGPEYVVPSVFNREVAPRVAAAVAEAAEAAGVARRPRAS
jgi:malate dehydrogenase (oxaloacetate-decarboxylating)